MIAEAMRRSPLADYAERFSALYEASNGRLSIRELPFVTQLNLRVDPREDRAMRGLLDVLGFDLPPTPNTVVSGGDRRALWLGPDEWLIVAPDGQAPALAQALAFGLGGAFGSIVDVSASRTILQVRGEHAWELLAHGIPIDLHSRAFPPGRCAETLLAKSPVIIERRSDDETFHLYVRASFAGYVAAWLLDAAGRTAGSSLLSNSPPSRRTSASPEPLAST